MKSAVDFLKESLSIHFTFEQKMQFEGLFQQAKEMEKTTILPVPNSIVHLRLSDETTYNLEKKRPKVTSNLEN